ncbi:hypothetical protein [Methylobacter sp. sgz302048]|uniref:hypothetical protein n=1 Tax=Methylobacter sp. sgz302048 TaxID=3455945 RepID=UPI003F9EEBB0
MVIAPFSHKLEPPRKSGRFKWFSNITYEERAPCNCEHCNNSTIPTFFDWKKLIQRLEEGRQTIECDNVRVKDVPVLPLLEGFTDAARIKRSVKPLKRSRGDQRDASIIVNITPPITHAPSVSKPESEEKSINQDLVMTHPQKPRPDIWKKMKIKALMFTGSIAIVWVFLAWAKPGSELKFLELFEVKQGEEQETNTKDKVAKKWTPPIGQPFIILK